MTFLRNQAQPKAAPKKHSKPTKKRAKTYTAEQAALQTLLAMLLIALGVMGFLAVALRMQGDVFTAIREVCYGLAGALAIVLPAWPVWLGVLLLVQTKRRMSPRVFLLFTALFLLAGALLTLMTSTGNPARALPDYFWAQANPADRDYLWLIRRSYTFSASRGAGGGALGMLTAYPLWRLIGPLGASAVGILLAVVLLLVLFRFDPKAFIKKMKVAGRASQAMRQAQWQNTQQTQWRQTHQPEPAPSWQQTAPVQSAPRQTQTSGFQPVPEETRVLASQDGPRPGFLNRFFGQKQPAEAPVSQNYRAARRDFDAVKPEPIHVQPQPQPDTVPYRAENKPVDFTEAQQENPRASRRKPAPQPAPPVDDTPPWDETPVQTPAPVMPVLKDPSARTSEPLNIKPASAGEKTLGERKQAERESQLSQYIYPSISLLKPPKPPENVSHEEDAMRARRLEETLASFKVDAAVRNITHGPAVSRFELELAPGIKVNKVTSLSDNIAMNMEAKSVRIEAPIPGKSLVGVEVPNRAVATVTLRELLESPQLQDASSPLAVALGRDIAGAPIVCDLSRMPHLLIAGATGSGKSVCINAIINSLLFRCSPEDVRMILVDPKVVELQCYNGVPHLLLPVVSDPRKASAALEWAVDEMMARYNKFKEVGVRGIDGYNKHLPKGEGKMPRIVIIIDELADLMMVCKRDVEERICRIAQLARAAGIHMVVATQRPSVDVITGLIKANIPSRIAFKVTSFVDSRTILDGGGAEQLLGWGDMLYKPVGQFTPTRIQGCFLTDEEVNQVTDFIRQTCPAVYDPEIIDRLEHAGDEDAAMPSTDDFAANTGPVDTTDTSLLAQCIEMAVEDGQVSTSMLQRRLRVGYSRAGRLVDEMEKRGIVSQQDGSKPRQCLISREEFEQMKASGSIV
jgi:DNA segregation ATPase FtsK/SpoIIIE-like protein